LNESKLKKKAISQKTLQQKTLSLETRSLSLSQGVLYGIGAGIGGSIFVLLGTGIEVAGPGILISLILGGILIFLTALNYSELSTSLPISGGAYNFSKEGMGGFFAFIIGFFLWVANMVACSFSAQAFTVTIQVFFPFLNPFVMYIAIFAILFMTFFFFKSQRLATKTLITSTIILLIIFAVFILSGLFLGPITNSSNFNPSFLAADINTLAIIQMFSLLFVFFTSITSNLAYLNSEMKNPSKSIPRANVLAILFTLGIYLSITAVVLINVGSNTEGLGDKPLLLADVLSNILGPFGFVLMGIAAIISTIIAMNAALGSATSVHSALARDKYMPKIFTKTNEETGVPVNSLIISVMISILFTVLAYLYGSIGFTAEITGFIYFFCLAFINFAAVALRRKRKELDRPFKAPFFPYLPTVVASICLVLAFTLELNAIFLGLIVFIIAIGYFLLKIADRNSIILTLAGMKLMCIIFVGAYVWAINNITVLSSTVPGFTDFFQLGILRVLIFVCIFGLGTVLLDVIPLREIALRAIKKFDKDKVAMMGIIEMKKSDLKKIYRVNLIVAYIQLFSALFIVVFIVIFNSGFISIQQITLGNFVITSEAAGFFFNAGLILLIICLGFGGLSMLFINREMKEVEKIE
jgi:amino acid transporter